ncbi:glycosyltransferase family 4 protein [Rhizosaccharibacter radicis]|uniref:Uncharacterized protein n=1 Tax=Rhizosaccharibacter radicis TaxID=2782605 RepID=A0ABT1VVW1_9PROT|nr:hypothetical protein [Acetobacteraceae bacterium KSS12]
MTAPAAIAIVGLLAAMVSALSVWRMIRVGVLDIPGHRSSHERPVPKGGGVGVLAAMVLCAVLLPAWPGAEREWPILSLLLLVVAALLLGAVSWADDLWQFRFAPKLAAQGGAALMAVVAGAWFVPDPLSAIVPAPVAAAMAVLAALFWMVFVTNAMNFIDGLNGLASGTGLVAALGALFLALTRHDGLVATLSLGLAAGFAGFLPFNYPRARIFMGDVGSQSGGLLLAALAPLMGRYAGAAHPFDALLVPMMLAGILWDVGFTLCRRLVAGERVTEAHRGHLYQVASRCGVPRPAVAAIHWMFAIWGAVGWRLLAGGTANAAIAAALLVPQIAWTLFVWAKAGRTGLRHWS